MRPSLIGVFCFEHTWRSWSAEQLVRELAGLRDLGVSAVVTETVQPPLAFIDAARETGLEAHISFPCFSVHSAPEMARGFELHPIMASGQPRSQLEWYTGVIPTNEGYNRRIQGLMERIAEAEPAGVVMDFVRWPLHWELELRAGAPEPEDSSFDETTLRAFADWLARGGRRPAGTLDAPTIAGPLRDAWADFKCQVITDFACSTAERLRAISPSLKVGAFVVPATAEQRRRLLGQDTVALGACLDLLLPMTYHAILHRDVEFIGQTTAEIRAGTAAEVVPVVQVTAEPEVAGGWDWGPEVSPAEFGRAAAVALRAAPSIVLFPFEGLSATRRTVLATVLEASSAGTDRTL